MHKLADVNMGMKARATAVSTAMSTLQGVLYSIRLWKITDQIGIKTREKTRSVVRSEMMS
jgi:hypothetical protein